MKNKIIKLLLLFSVLVSNFTSIAVRAEEAPTSTPIVENSEKITENTENTNENSGEVSTPVDNNTQPVEETVENSTPVQPANNTPSTIADFLIIENNVITGFKEGFVDALNNNYGGILNIPDGVTTIGASVFRDVSIKSVVLPNSVGRIEEYTFYRSGLTAINLDRVHTIGGHALQDNQLSQVNITSLENAGEYAFADNEIQSVDLANSQLTTIADSLFRNNNITSVNTGTTITSIGNSAFADNKITNVSLDSVRTIGDGVFESNNLSNVQLIAPITLGTNVFNNNGRYVIVDTDATNITGEKSAQYGYVVNPVSVLVKYVDRETGEEIISPKLLGEDLTVDAFPMNAETIYILPPISGYEPETPEFTFTPTHDKFEITAYYNSVRKLPTITTVPKSYPANALIDKAELLRGITAQDFKGVNLSDRITVTPENVDSAVSGVNKVTYSVTDDYGNTKTEVVDVSVGIDWNKYELGGGWLVEDFTYNGNMVTGLSDKGRTKINNNKTLYLPSVNNLGQPVSIFSAGMTFYNKQLSEVHIPSNYTEIRDNHAFSHNQLTTITIPEGIGRIPNSAFANNLLETIVWEGTPTIERIENDAFANNKFKVLNNLPNSIKYLNGFNSNQLTSITLPENVEVIGHYAFYHNRGLSIPLVMPKSLKRIERIAFYSTTITGVTLNEGLEYIGDSAFSSGPSIGELTVPDSVVEIGNSAFQAVRMQDLIISENSKLEKIGSYAFDQNKLTSVYLPDTLKHIGERAFAYNNRQLKTLRLPTENLEHIGNYAFAYSGVSSDIAIGSKVNTLGNYAFASNNIKNLTFEDGGALKRIGNYAFVDNLIENLNIPGNIQTIGNVAFSANNLKSLTLNEGLTTIGNRAFEYDKQVRNNSNYGVQIPSYLRYDNNTWTGHDYSKFSYREHEIPSLTIPSTVTSIGEEAFQASLDINGTLTIPANVSTLGRRAFMDIHADNLVIEGGNLTTIPEGAFARTDKMDNTLAIFDRQGDGKSFNSITIGNSVTNIEANAFANSRASSLDLPDNLVSVGDNAFSLLNIDTQSIPSTLTQIGTAGFSNISKETPSNPNKVIVLTTDTQNNPNNLVEANVTDKNRNWAIDPYTLTLHFQDQDGNTVFPTEVHNVRNMSKPATFTFPPKYGYETPADLSYDYEVDPQNVKTIIYRKLNEQERALLDANSRTYGLNHSKKSTNETYAHNSQMISEVALDLSGSGKGLTQGKIVIKYDPNHYQQPVVETTSSVKKVTYKDGEVVIELNDLTGGAYLGLPVKWKFGFKDTPFLTPLPIQVSLFDGQGTPLTEDNDVFFKRYVEGQDAKKNTKLGYSSRYSAVKMDNDKVLDEPDNYVVYTFNSSASNYYRRIVGYTIEDILPTYELFEGGTATAIFDANANPGWVLSDDGTKVTYTGTDDGIVMPTLKLRFPNAKKLKNVINTANFKYEYSGMTQEERNANVGVYRRSITNHFDVEPLPTGNLLDKYAYSPWNNGREYGYFYDNNPDRSKDFIWRVNFWTTNENTHTLKMEDFNLDDRMYYAKFYLYSETLYGGTLKAYDSDDNILFEKIITGYETVLPEDIAKNIYKVSYEHNNLKALPNSYYEMGIGTKLKYPQDPHFNPADPEANKFYNTAKIETTSKNAEGVIRTAEDTAHFVVREINQQMHAWKNVYDFPNNSIAGTKGRYRVGINVAYTYLKENVKDFFAIDLMPKGVSVESITPGTLMNKYPSLTYEIVENYNNSERTAVIFRSPELQTEDIRDLGDIADIHFKTSEGISDGTHTNNFYVTWSNPEIKKHIPVTNPPFIPEGVYTQASANISTVKAKELLAIKSIRKEGDLAWSNTGIKMLGGEKFEYKLSLINNTNREVFTPIIIDVFPYEGDKYYVANQNGEKLSRGSQFANKFDVIKGLTLPEGSMALYFNSDTITDQDLNPNNTINWSLTPAENTKAVAIAFRSIKANSTLDVIIPMIAPENNDLSKSGMRAYNTFARHDAVLDKSLETNKVYNEIVSPLGSIVLRKTDQRGTPLEGAIFKITTPDGVAIKTATSNTDGLVLFDKIHIDNYVITEIKAPSGYKISSEPIQVAKDVFNQAENKVLNLGDVKNAKIWTPIQPIEGDITLKKVNAEGNPLRNVQFKLKGASDWNKDIEYKAFTNIRGILTFRHIPSGKWIVEEIPYGMLQPIEPKEVIISWNSKLVDLGTLVNDKIQIDLVKLSVLPDRMGKPLHTYSGLDGIGIDGAMFELSDENGGKTIVGPSSAEGIITLSNLIPNHTYTLKEIKSPKKHALASEVMTFRVDASGKTLTTANGDLYKGTKLFFPNRRLEQTSVATIQKVGTTDTNTTIPLNGVEYTLYKQDDTGVFVLESVQRTNDQGVATFPNLTMGMYKLKETDTINGYYLNTREEVFTVEQFEAKTFTYNYTNQHFNPYIVKYDIIKENIGEQEALSIQADFAGSKVEKISDGIFRVVKYLRGAIFTVTDKESGTLIETITTDGHGIGRFTEKLDYRRTYNIVETTAPDGYVANNKTYVLNMMDYYTQKQQDIPIYIVNKPLVGRINITKMDYNTGQRLQGVEFTLSFNGKVKQTVKTNSNGIIRFDNLPYGDYVVTETKPLNGYILDAQPERNITVNADNIVNNIVMYNKLTPKSIKINKTTSDGQILEDLEFTLYRKNGTKVATANTNDQGVAVFENLNPEEYYVKETGTHERYEPNTKKYDVNLLTHNTSEYVLNVENKLKTMRINIVKSSAHTYSYAGTEFKVYERDTDRLVHTVTFADGETNKVVEVPFGDYYVTETKASANYTINRGDAHILERRLPTTDYINGEYPQIDAEFYNLPTSFILQKHWNGKPEEEGGTTGGMMRSAWSARNSGNLTAIVNVLKPNTKEVLKFTKQADDVYKYDEAGTITDIPLDITVTFLGIPAGQGYEFREIDGPNGWKLGSIVADVTQDNFPRPQTIVNNPIILILNKIGEGNTPLSGYKAKFMVNGFPMYTEIEPGINNYHNYNVDDLQLDNLDDGVTAYLIGPNIPYSVYKAKNYAFVETDSPDGYALTRTPSVHENGVEVLYNTKNRLRVNKVDSNTNQLITSDNAIFQLSDGNTTLTFDTTDKGYATLDGIPDGEYTLTETKVPNGYVKGEDIQIRVEHGLFYTCRKTENGCAFDEGGEGTLTLNVANDKLKLKITKTDAKGAVLEGVEFELWSVDNPDDIGKNTQNLVGTKTTNNEGKTEFINLSRRVYYLKEIKTKTGYRLLDKPIMIDMTNVNAEYTKVVVNGQNVQVLPEAGTQDVLIIVGMATVFIGLAVFLMIKKKKDN